MSAAIRAEVRKLLSTRLWWLLALVLVAYLVFIAAVMTLSFTVDLPGAQTSGRPAGVDLARTVYALTSPIGYVFPLIVGSLVFTNEFRHQTITATVLVEPRRTVLLLGKLIVAGLIGLVYGVVGTASTVLGAAPVLAVSGDGAFLTDRSVIVLLLMSVVVMALWAVLGAAVGGVLTNQVAAIIVILAFTQFVEPIGRLALGAWDLTSGVARYLPGAAADALLGSSFFAQAGAVDLLPRFGGGILLLAYIAVFALVARYVTLRRDIG